jgi:hypothetical protein
MHVTLADFAGMQASNMQHPHARSSTVPNGILVRADGWLPQHEHERARMTNLTCVSVQDARGEPGSLRRMPLPTVAHTFELSLHTLRLISCVWGAPFARRLPLHMCMLAGPRVRQHLLQICYPGGAPCQPRCFVGTVHQHCPGALADCSLDCLHDSNR